MITRRLAALCAATLLATTGLVASQTASADGPQPLPLHNDSAGGGECPDDGNAYWHFVLTPNNGTSSFVSITLNLGGVPFVFTGAQIIPNESQTDNVFVAVPEPYDLDDLVKAGSSAVVTGPASKFVLSHLCPGDGTDPGSPVVTIEKTAEVAHSFYYPWTVDKEITDTTVVFGDGWPYLLVDYNVTPIKGDTPEILAGSYVVTGTIHVTVAGDGVTLTSIVDELNGATCTLDEAPDLTAADIVVGYTCEVAGLPAGQDLNVATVDFTVEGQAKTLAGTAPVDYDASVGTEVANPYTLSDDQYGGLPVGGGEYSLEVYPTVENCDPGFTNTVTLDPLYGPNATDHETVHVCNTVGGHTIGYWFASPAGSALTAGSIGSLKATYVNILGNVGIQNGNVKSVKSFGQKASCSGNCWTMLQAQFIATAMSVLHHNTGSQCMLVPTSIDVDGEMTIQEFLGWINTNVGNDNLAETVLVKDLLDAINNDSAIACP